MPKTVEPKAPKAKKSEETVVRTKRFNGLVPSVIKVLQTLRDAGVAMTRKELAESTGIEKGWSKILGTKDGGNEEALGPIGYVLSVEPKEGERGMKYKITAAGKQALVKAEKEMAKAGSEG